MTLAENDIKIYEEFLASHEVQECQYTTGLFQDGITIYKQQIRALNLFYSLIQSGKIKTGSKVCVIGAGVSGLTFSAAALKADIDVLLLEKESIFLPLQHGCDIRQVHPNLYNWPRKGARFPFTKLPLLSWKADTASNVSKQIFEDFAAIVREVRNPTLKKVAGSTKADGTPRQIFKGYVDVKVDRNVPLIEKRDGTFRVSFRGKPFKIDNAEDKDTKGRPSTSVDIIIYCTGFGIEVSCENQGPTPSYWRNDDWGQMIVNGKNKFHISGLGDGALIDLFRLKILGFSYDAFLNYYESLPNEPEITEALLQIKNHAEEDLTLKPRDYYEKFDQISEVLTPLAEYLKDNKRTKVTVTLAGHREGITRLELNELIDLKKVSFINALIFYLLLMSNDDGSDDEDFWFTFIPGKTEKNGNGYLIKEKKANGTERESKLDDSVPILRHGTNRLNAFSETRISPEQIELLREKQRNSKTFLNDAPLWTHEDISLLFKGEKTGFCTDETITLCSTFVSILKHLITRTTSKFRKGVTFKVCLFRVMATGNGFNFQSITPYFGDKGSGKEVGKLIPYENGLLGMCSALKEPILFKRIEKELNDILEVLQISINEIFKDSKSVLCVPILGRVSTTESAANLILCMDSNLSTFFDDENMLNALTATATGWIESIDKFVEGKQILMDDVVSIPPLHISAERLRAYQTLKKYRSFKANTGAAGRVLRTLKPRANPLIFNKFHSFEVYYNLMPTPSYVRSQNLK